MEPRNNDRYIDYIHSYNYSTLQDLPHTRTHMSLRLCSCLPSIFGFPLTVCERDTESRYHSVVSYITYLLKRPFFSVLGLVPIWTKIILLLSQISAHSLKLVWTQHYGPDALKQQSMSRWILARLCWAESRLIRLTHSCRQNTELPRIATIFT